MGVESRFCKSKQLTDMNIKRKELESHNYRRAYSLEYCKNCKYVRFVEADEKKIESRPRAYCDAGEMPVTVGIARVCDRYKRRKK